MKKSNFDAFKEAWINYPSQDNEGYIPDRGGFKAGWFSALEYIKQQQELEIKLESTKNLHNNKELERRLALVIDLLSNAIEIIEK